MARNDHETLQHLATICTDAANLYDEAAELAPPSLARELESLATDRRELLGRFQAFGMTEGKDIREETSVMGEVHEAFMQARALIESDAKAAVAEVERGEDYLRDEVRKALDSDDISIGTRMFLSDIKGELEFGHERMSSLKHALEDGVPVATP